MSARELAQELIWRACRRLPEPDRSLRRQEWTAEVDAILDDQGTRWRARRQVRAVSFAAGHLRGARRMAGPARYPVTELPALFPFCIMIVALLIVHLAPLAYPVRLALGVLVMAAAMAFQNIRERRYWLARGNGEPGGGRLGRLRIYGCWIWALSSLLVNGLLLNRSGLAFGWYTWLYAGCCAVLFGAGTLFIERRIFTRPGLAGHTGKQDEDCLGHSTPPA